MVSTMNDDGPREPAGLGGAERRRFHTRSLEWLRDHEQLHMRVLPEEVLPEENSGLTLVHGHLVASRHWGSLAYAGLVLLVAAWLLIATDARFGPRGSVLGAVGLAALVLAWLAFVGAAWSYWHTRTPVLVLVLLDDEDRPASWERLEAFAARVVRGQQRWALARQGFEPVALELGARAGLRCLDGPRPERAAAYSTERTV